eukprot:1129702-Rhodomonas_salina.1
MSGPDAGDVTTRDVAGKAALQNVEQLLGDAEKKEQRLKEEAKVPSYASAMPCLVVTGYRPTPLLRHVR